jgi:hypothetical protein
MKIFDSAWGDWLSSATPVTEKECRNRKTTKKKGN